MMATSDEVYAERDMLVAALSKMFYSHLSRHPSADLGWEAEWRNIVCIHGPHGTMTWHIHERELPWFAHLSYHSSCLWDGHSTADKYWRLAKINGPDC